MKKYQFYLARKAQPIDEALAEEINMHMSVIVNVIRRTKAFLDSSFPGVTYPTYFELRELLGENESKDEKISH